MGSRDQAVAQIKSGFVVIAKRVLLAGLASLGPLGANPFIQSLASAILDPILKYLSNQGEMAAFFLFIDWRTAKQSKEFVDAAIANAKAQSSGDKLAKKKAEEALWNAARSFIRYNS